MLSLGPARALRVCVAVLGVFVACLAGAGASQASAAPGASDHIGATASSAARSTPILLSLGIGYETPHGLPAVRTLQRLLRLAGHDPGPIDGRYGPLTRDAVLAFQVSQGLPADGITGPRTLSALTASRLSLSPGAGDEPGGSARVRALQRSLRQAGDTPGPIDGRYGALTELAVRRFQAAHDLPVTGTAGTRTLALLFAARPSHLSRPASRPTSLPPSRHVSKRRVVTGAGIAPVRPSHLQTTRRRRTASPPFGWLVGVGAVAMLLLSGTAYLTTRRRAVRGPRRPQPRPSAQTPATIASGTSLVTLAASRDTVVDEAASLFELGVELERNGRVAEAQEAYRQADRGGHGAAAANLGVLLEEGGAITEAEAAYRRADARGDPAGAFNLGVLLEEHGALAQARVAYRRADERGYGPAAANLGVLCEELGAEAEAEAAYRRAVDRGDAVAAFNLGVLLERKGQLVEAQASYRHASELGSANVADGARAAVAELGDTLGNGAHNGAAGSRHDA